MRGKEGIRQIRASFEKGVSVLRNQVRRLERIQCCRLVCFLIGPRVPQSATLLDLRSSLAKIRTIIPLQTCS
jgi:hypothetical protein